VLDRHLTGPTHLSMFNAGILSHLANREWGYDTIFLRYSDLLPQLADYVGAVLEEEASLRAAYLADRRALSAFHPKLPSTPLYWLICRNCRRRFIPSGTGGTDNCPDCGTAASSPRRALRELCAEGSLVPRVAVDDLLHGLVIRPALSVSYLSSANHVLSSLGVIQAFGGRPIHLLWRPRPIRFSIAELMAIRLLGRGPDPAAARTLDLSLLGRGSLLYALLTAPSSIGAAAWRAHWARPLTFAQSCSYATYALPRYQEVDEGLVHRLIVAAQQRVST
jgi:hypothetical protein